MADIFNRQNLINKKLLLLQQNSAGSGKYSGGTQDSCSCNYYIRQGCLYYNDGRSFPQLGADDNWTAVCGYSSKGSASADVYAYGICGGKLYALLADNAPVQIGNYEDWKYISGQSYMNSSGFAITYALGIRTGKLYTLMRTSASLLDESGVWTAISGYCTSDKKYAAGIKNGMIYAINASNIYGISNLGNDNIGVSGGFTEGDSDSTIYVSEAYAWKKNTLMHIMKSYSGAPYGYRITGSWDKISTVKGYYLLGSNDNRFPLIIADKKLYSMQPALIQIGSDTGWTSCTSGYDGANAFGYGVLNKKLYRISGAAAEQIWENKPDKWSDLSGVPVSTSSWAYVINNKILYGLKEENGGRVLVNLGDA